MTPQAIADAIHTTWQTYLTRQAHRGSSHPYVYASAYRACDRRIVYEMVQPGTLPLWSPEMLARFRRGDDRERDLLADLSRMGRDADEPFDVQNQQERFTLRDRRGRVAIVGKVDARLQINGSRPPVEVKAWSPFIVDRLTSFADLFENPWTIGGAHQLLAYLYGAGEPFGFLLLDRSGLPLLLPVELEAHLDRMEAFLVKAERALDHVEADTLPGYLDDPTECKRCPWYGHTCQPPLHSEGAAVLSDPELEAQLERREQLKDAGREYLDLDKAVKERLRGVTLGVAGKFAITGKWSRSSVVELPPDLKRYYTKSDPHGRFLLTIEKVAP